MNHASSSANHLSIYPSSHMRPSDARHVMAHFGFKKVGNDFNSHNMNQSLSLLPSEVCDESCNSITCTRPLLIKHFAPRKKLLRHNVRQTIESGIRSSFPPILQKSFHIEQSVVQFLLLFFLQHKTYACCLLHVRGMLVRSLQVSPAARRGPRAVHGSGKALVTDARNRAGQDRGWVTFHVVKGVKVA